MSLYTRNRTVRRLRSIGTKFALVAAATVLGSPLAGCGEYQSALDPKGPRADQTAGLWWTSLAVGGAIYLLVVGLLVYALFKRRGGSEGPGAPPGPRDGQAFVLAGGVLLPLVVLTGIFIFAIGVLNDLSRSTDDSAMRIEVTGNLWWWEVSYPDYGFETANEIHIPVGERVALDLTSSGVIHSFWVPELSGKTDLIPGQTNNLWLEAGEPGIFRGQCAEFCGIQHANMAFHVVADQPEDFQAWVEQQQQDQGDVEDETLRQGQQVFLGSGCVACHTIEGTNATGDIGPDLTHLASRNWIAAGTLRLNEGNLAAWIVDPQHFKPGTLMPPTDLSGQELQAMVAYLMSLE